MVQYKLIKGTGCFDKNNEYIEEKFRAENKCDCCKKIVKDSSIVFDDGEVYQIKLFEFDLKERGWLLYKKVNNKYYDFCSEKCYKEFLEKQK